MRLYAALLHLFPASFRAEYGAEMTAIFARRRRQAKGPLANAALWAETLADVVGNAVGVHLDLLRQDLHYSGRTLTRSRGFAITAVVVSALGIGATTATFSITDHVLARPLPFAGPEHLVALFEDQSGYSQMELSPANYRDWKRQASSFESMAVFSTTSVNLVGEGAPERLDGIAVDADLFTVLGMPPLVGRVFAAEDDREGATGTLVLSYRLWNRRFGGDRAVVGRSVLLDGTPYQVIGVMPARFRFPTRDAAFWVPLRFGEQSYVDRDNNYLRGVARLKPEVSLEQARTELNLVAAQIGRSHPEQARTGASVFWLRDQMSEQSRLLLLALFGASLCVLLIACANLAGLLFARGLARRKELALLAALGAGRERMVRQMLTESLLLALAGGALGVLLAVSAIPLLARLVPNSLPIAETPQLDLRVLGFAALATAVTGIGFGMLPALRASGRADAADVLREGGRGGVGGARERLRATIVVAEVAVSIVLLVGSGLLLEALWRVQQVDPGFRAAGVLTLRTALPTPRYQATLERARFYSTVLEGVRRLPGVTSAAYVSFLPMAMRGGVWPVEIPGVTQQPGDLHRASLRFVTPGFFQTLAIPLLRGRDVSDADDDDKEQVAVVSQSFAEHYWPGQDPLGRRFGCAFRERAVVGVVGDIRVRGLERSSEPQVYLPHRQVADGALSFYTPKDLVIRTSADTATLLPTVRRIVAAADVQQPVSDVRAMSDIVAGETASRGLQARVLGGFAAVAVLLAGLGIHGLLAFTVSLRAPEIGVRMALGASRRDILQMVLGRAAVLAAIGAGFGLILAYLAGRTLEALLAGVSPHDPLAFLTAAGVSMLAVILGGMLPALRAARLDPLTVLRAE